MWQAGGGWFDRAVPFAQVRAERLVDGAWAPAGTPATASRYGGYVLKGLAAGRYRVSVNDAQAGTVYHPGENDPDRARVVRTRAGRTVRHVRVRLPRRSVTPTPSPSPTPTPSPSPSSTPSPTPTASPTASPTSTPTPVPGGFTGRLLSLSGEPLSGVDVHVYTGTYASPKGVVLANHVQTRTDTAGRFRLDVVANSYYVYAGARWPWGCERLHLDTETVRVEPGGLLERDLQLLPLAEVTGTVTDDTTGEPVAGVPVASQALFGLACEVRGATDAQGRYTLEGVRPGDHRVAFSRRHLTYLPEYYGDTSVVAEATRVSLASGETRSGVDAALLLGGRITGRLTLPDGTPMTDVTVRTFHGEDPYAGQAQVGTDGRFELLGLPAGDHMLRFEPGSDATLGASTTHCYDGTSVATREPQDTVTIPVTRGSHLDLDVEVDAGSALSGRVTDLAGDARVGRTVTVDRRVRGDWRLESSSSTDSDGRYTIGVLGAGDYRIEIGVAEWYAGGGGVTTDPDAARVVTLASMQTMGGLDASVGTDWRGRVLVGSGSPDHSDPTRTARLHTVAGNLTPVLAWQR